MVRDICANYHPPPPLGENDAEFYSYVRSHYLQAKESGERTELFVFAAGLLTYGEIEMVDDILDNIPSGKGHIRRFAWTVNVLFPAPKELDALENAPGLKRWFHENRDTFYWDEQEFIFRWKPSSEH